MSRSIPRHLQSSDAQIRNFTGVVEDTVQIEPYNAQSFNTTNSRKIKFRLPRTGVLCGKNSFIRAGITVAGGSADHLVSCFEFMKVQVGNTLIMDEQYFGEYRTKEADAYLMSDEANSATVKVTGYRQTNADDTTVTKRMYLSHPKFWKRGLFSINLPLFKMPQVIIEVELWSDINKFTSGDATSVTLDNVRLFCNLLDGDSIRSQYAGEIKSSFKTHDRHYRSIANGATKINELIPAHYNNVNFVLIDQKSSALVDLGVTANNYNFSSNHTLNSINHIELQIDGERFPKIPIETDDAVEIVDNLQRCWQPNSQFLGDIIHNYADKSDESSMYIGVPLAVSRKTISGQKLSNKSGTIIVKADITAAQDTDLNLWVDYDKFFAIAENGSIRVVE